MIGAEPEEIIATCPPSTAWICGAPVSRLVSAVARARTYLAEDEAVPERVCSGARRAELQQLRVDRTLEQRAAEAWDVPGDHRGLVYAVQDARHAGEEDGLQDLGVFQQPQGVPGEGPEGASDGDDRELTQALSRCHECLIGTGTMPRTHSVNVSQREV